MSFIMPAIAGISALGSALSNRKAKSTQTNTPNLSPDQSNLYHNLVTAQGNLMNPTDLSGYQAGQEDDINHMAQLQKQNTAETLAARGISGPARAYAANRVDKSRFAQIAKLRAQIPLLQRQFGTEAINSGVNVLKAVQPGSTTTGTTPGNVLGGAIGGGASTLAYFLGQGAFSKPTAAPSGGGGGVGSDGLPYTGNS